MLGPRSPPRPSNPWQPAQREANDRLPADLTVAGRWGPESFDWARVWALTTGNSRRAMIADRTDRFPAMACFSSGFNPTLAMKTTDYLNSVRPVQPFLVRMPNQ